MGDDNLRLEPPNVARADSYRALVREFLVHGEPPAQDALVAQLTLDGYDVEAPASGDRRAV